MTGYPKFKMSHVTATTPLSAVVCHHHLALSVVNLITKFEVSNSTGYKDKKGNAKCRKLGGLGYLWVTQAYWK